MKLLKDYFKENINEKLLEAYGNFPDNTKYNDWSEFKSNLQTVVKVGFKNEDELLDLMKMDKKKYNDIKESIILNWKDSVTKSLIHTIAEIGYKLPKKGDNIFKDLKQQTLFLYVIGQGLQQKNIYGDINGIDGLHYISRFDAERIKNTDPKNTEYDFNLHKDVMKKFVDVGGVYAVKCRDQKCIDKVNEVVQYIWLYSFYNHYKMKKEKIKLPKYLYRGIRASNLFNHKNIKDITDEIFKQDKSHELKRKEVIDMTIDYIIKNGLNKLSDGKTLSFTASKPIASYFANGEGFIVRIDPEKVDIVTSEKTEKLLDEPDYVSNKKEREYLVKIPANYKFNKNDIEIEDLDYLVAEQNPLSVQFFDSENKFAVYELNGHKIKARVFWNSAGNKTTIHFEIDDRSYQTRNQVKKEFNFDPMPTAENLKNITNFEIKKSKNY